MAVLAGVPDPEIPVVSVVDLGIVRGLSDDGLRLIITPTYSGCPATQAIAAAVRLALDAAGYPHIAVESTLSPAWTTDWISDDGREKLLGYGIAPPPKGAAQASLRNREPAICPQCRSNVTREISRFGSTPCKAQWVCDSCFEPFDRFKCH